ncbi:28S ribosomal protein S14, mitochondrial isoform X3 [Orcinus orca]|uniref:28S ribosomal protein S14, mitochondrial isoform X3 n=1 Tax=Orcinus orca TaxID=9733 RepID=UPI00144151EF|nr:28S ribosomal protein S14, mitochondrial isoform X3 [Orcinus orca]
MAWWGRKRSRQNRRKEIGDYEYRQAFENALPQRGAEKWVVPSSASGQVRSYYVDWKMLRDVKRRKMAYEYADERLRINSLRKNTILPKDLQPDVLEVMSLFTKLNDK